MENTPQDRLDRFVQTLLACQGRLYQYIRSAMPRSQEVDDVLQETFLVMWQKFDESYPPEGFYPWARRIAHLKVLEAFARRGRDMPGLSPQVIELISVEEATDPDFLVDIKLMLQDCLDKLSPSDRELIEWRYEPNARVDDIAARLGRPANSVSKSLGRIRETLCRCVNESLESQRKGVAAERDRNDKS